jgi:DNA-binding transcriptional LysR family regulator
VDLDVRQLRVFATLLDERNLTRAAEVLGVTQPALSKTLAGLRRHFGDPLLVRVGHRMEPTARALELEGSVRAILEQLTSLRVRHVPFDPQTSTRVFRFCVVDAGLIKLMPRLIRYLHEYAPHVTLHVLPVEIEGLEASLESGRLDFAMGSYPALSKKVRRQTLWSVTYISAVRADHPRLTTRPTLKAFAAEKHVVVSAAGTGHAHQQAERALERAVPAENLTCRVPTFVTAALIASETDAVVTLPRPLAEELAPRLNLRLVPPPVRLPRIDVSQHWHERFHRDAGIRWIREVFSTLYAPK